MSIPIQELTRAESGIRRHLRKSKEAVSLPTLCESLPESREDAVRLAFWHMVQRRWLRLDKRFRATLAA